MTNPSEAIIGKKSQTVRGVIAYCGAVFMIAAMDASAKWVADTHPAGQMLYYRALFGFLPIFVMYSYLKRKEKAVKIAPNNWRAQIKRGISVSIVTILFFVGIRTTPLTEATTIMMTVPIQMVLLGVLLLGERSTWLKWICVVVGFAGVLLVLQPSASELSGLSFLLLIAAFFQALASVQTRALLATETFLQIMVFSTFVMLLLSGIMMPFEKWVTPSYTDLLVLISLGIAGSVSGLLFVSAFSDAEVSVLAPFDYSILLWATIFGFFVFSELPSALVMAAATLIAASGVILAKAR